MVHLADCDWPRLTDAFVALGIFPPDVPRARVEGLMARTLRPFVLAEGGAMMGAAAKRIDTPTLALDFARAAADVPFTIPPYTALLTRAVTQVPITDML